MRSAIAASMRTLACLVLFVAACASASSAPSPDAAVLPLDPSGRFEVRSTLMLSAPPPMAAMALADLAATTDGLDDPSRYVIDLVIARLPDGHIKTIASVLAPYVAVYVNERLDRVAPRFVDGVRALAAGLDRISRRFVLTEDVTLTPGHVQRRITGVELDGVQLAFGPLETSAIASLDGGHLVIAAHAVRIPYGGMLRTGFDRAVIPRVVPGATDLAHALRELVDCATLGALVAERVGLGSPELYADACVLGLAVAAANLYARFPTREATLALSGVGHAADHTGDSTIDVIEAGTWTGALDGVPLASGTFEGTSR